MTKAKFIYVELADPYFSRKGIVVKVDEIEINSEDVDRCRTWATYPEGLKTHCKDKGTIRGYNGLVCCDFIPIDIDDLDPSKVEAVVKILNDYDVSTECLSFYFSGCKGFHIEIPSAIVGIDPLPVKEFNKRIKKFIKLLGLDCDMSMYKSHQLYRLSNTLNGKSNLFKIPIEYSEIRGDFKIIAKSPRFETFTTKVTELNDTLNGIWLETAVSLKTPKLTKDFSSNIILSAQSIDTPINSLKTSSWGVKKGNRNTTGSSLTIKLMMEGYIKEDALNILMDWNCYNIPPLDLTELINLFDSNWRYGEDFELTKTRNFRANFRNDIVCKEYQSKEDKAFLSVYIHILFNMNDEDKIMKLDWGEQILIKRNQIIVGYEKLAKKLKLKTKKGEWSAYSVKKVVSDLVEKKRIEKLVIGKTPKKTRLILTWIHFNFTQSVYSNTSPREKVEDFTQ
ncbi:MAG: hypothetical protein HOK35_18300 [Cytophagia bacterium]|nr:hypothetical protein [Cytophagia bacterium]